MSDQSSFHFPPRPEAHAMAWDDLLPPVKRAVRDLLVHIHDAEQIKENDEVANCFLVYGDRGTGKTTVLLSAKDAIYKEEYFTIEENAQGENPKERKRHEKSEEKEWRKDSQECAKKLREQGIVWLEVLDLEPLPSEANLLTTVLTRVRNALDTPDSKKKGAGLTSLFEEDANSARQQLGRLIDDATLMWEDIHEVDTRNRANRQVAAANIYADFSNRFKEAMDKLSRELGHLHGSQSKPCSIVLPIDNIDRSTDHLYAIIKLAQMVSCRRLWLLMAGDRQDIDTFLERAFWKELIRVRDGLGAGARGKMGFGEEDESYVMARRQAAAASQKILPSSHRVKVRLVDPEETLNFYPPDKDKAQTIRALLKDVPIPTRKKNKMRYDLRLISEVSNLSKEDKQKFIEDATLIAGLTNKSISLLDLFDASSWVDGKDSQLLTHVAQHGLRLSARGVLDLWQLVYWAVTRDQTLREIDIRAEKIARAMLRNAIAGSTVTNWLSQELQDQTIRRTEDGGTSLYLKRVQLSIKRLVDLVEPDFEIRPVCNPPEKLQGFAIRSNISVKCVKDTTLFIGSQENALQFWTDSWERELPDLVAAWLMVLYDILLVEDNEHSSVVGTPTKFDNNIVSVSHEVIARSSYRKNSPLSVVWDTPEWGMFWAHEVFLKQWRNKLQVHKDSDNPLDQNGSRGYDLRLMSVATMANIEGEGRNLVIVALVGTDLYIRIFDANGQRVIDKSESELMSGQVLTALKEQLKPIPDISGLSKEDKQKIIEDATLIAGHTRCQSWLLVIAWVACVSETFAALSLSPPTTPLALYSLKDMELDKKVFKAAAALYDEIINENPTDLVLFDKMLRRAIRKWFELKLPLLLSYFYVPIKADNAYKSIQDVIKEIQGTKLLEYWKENAPFILANIDEELSKFFSTNEVQPKESDSKKTVTQQSEITIKAFSRWASDPLKGLLEMENVSPHTMNV